MKTLLLTVLLVLALGCLGGCATVPISGYYYKPAASEGDIQGYGDHYAPTTLALKRGKDRDITLLVSGFFLGGSQEKITRPSVKITPFVPVGEVLKTDLSALRIYGDSSAPIGKASPVYAMNRARIHGDIKMEDTTRAYSGNTSPAYGNTLFYTDIPIEGVPPKVLKVELPAMEADGISYPPLTVTFTYTHGWWWQVYGP